MSEAIERSQRRMARGRNGEQNGWIAAFASNSSSTAKDALAVIRQELEIADSIDAKLKFRMQFLDPAAIGKRAGDSVAERDQAQSRDMLVSSAAISRLPRVACPVRAERG